MDQRILIVIAALAGGAAYYFLRRRRRESPASQGAYTRDYTAEARAGHYDPVIGRDDEIDRVISIISRRGKNNPLLIGEPGVGKTAIIKGLAQRIVQKRVPGPLLDKSVLALNLADLMSGTGYRGELEQRIRSLMDRLEGLKGKIVLFIDELHMIEQTKGSQGGLNLPDMLKPFLVEGDIPVVGATTWEEYETHLRPDPAIDRRFQPVLVGEPSRQDSISILRGLKKVYEDFHGVTIDDSAIETAVDLSAKLIKDRFLPDKAIDLIDEAAAKASIEATLGHKAPLGVMDAASREARLKRIREESEALEDEGGHLERLGESFPDDPNIAEAAHGIHDHLRDLREAERAVADQKERPAVSSADIESLVKEWQQYYRSQSKP